MNRQRIKLSDVFRHSWRGIRTHWKTVIYMIWLPSLGMSIVGVLLNHFLGDEFLSLFSGVVGERIVGEGVSFITFHGLLFALISALTSLLAQGIVGSSWLLWLSDCKDGKNARAWTYHRWRHPVHRKFCLAWTALYFVEVGSVVAVSLVWSVGFGNAGVQVVMLSILIGIPLSSYMLGRYSMALPASLKTLQTRRFKESWQQTSSIGGELTGLFFVARYLLPFVLLIPSQILQTLLAMLGFGDMMSKALLVSFVGNGLALTTVCFLVGGLFYLYDGLLKDASKQGVVEGGNYE